VIPLYKQARRVASQLNFKSGPFSAANRGLVYDKFSDTLRVKSQDKKTSALVVQGNTVDFLTKFCQDPCKETEKLLRTYICRRHRLAWKLGAKIIQAGTKWRFISGLGAAHVLETGFVWHPTLGVPYIPASSIKGAMRAYLTYWLGEDEEAKFEAKRLFGDSDRDGVGCLLVFDALPCRVPQLDIDIMSPHYGDYYTDPSRNLPGDYYSPVPINFLAVAAKQQFEFCLAPYPGKGSESDLKQGQRILEETLGLIGCGAKTAVGYGVFCDFKDISASIYQKLTEKEQKERLAALSPLERRLLELKIASKTETNHDRLKNMTVDLFNDLEQLEPKEQQRAAQVLKEIWIAMDDWKGKISKKQGLKVERVKQILGEEN